ncbi:MAG: hypothetical protein QOE53_1590, partial [Pseudonocardiales bacterium]|nr:hypothetical protein [Pseudonocardiales bacterium]
RYLWYGAAAGLVVLALVLTRTQHGTNRAAPSSRSSSVTGPASAPSRTLSSSPASSGSFVDPPPTSVTASSNGLSTGLPAGVGPVQVTTLGHPLLDVPADWELFAQGPGVVVRIQLALGRITTTPVPVLTGEAPVAFVVGPDRVFVRALENAPGYVVRDGKRPTELPLLLQQAFSMWPGPDQKHLWTQQPGGEQNQLALLNLDGSSTGVTIDVPTEANVLGSDGGGYLLLAASGGIYDARPGGAHRITSGGLLASGPTRWLVHECDDSLSCADVVIDRASGAHRRVKIPVGSVDLNSGMLSPDGRTAAMLVPSDGISASSIQLLDLDSGAALPVLVNISAPEFQLGPQWAWSPDSRWLFVADTAGRVIIIDRGTGRATPLRTRLAPINRLVLRHGAG